jgi:hypothetical protein
VQIAFCQRRLANGEPERPEVPIVLRAAGHDVREIDDGDGLDFSGADIIWIQGNANWYPQICARLEPLRDDKIVRPRVILWHTEPLPPPRNYGLPRPRLHLREIAKIVLRDRRATDPYTNAARLRHLAKHKLVDVVVASSRMRHDYLTSCGITSHFIPLGYHVATHGSDLGLTRDIDVLFLGTMQVPRRRQLIAQLASAGVTVRIEGSWTNRGASWGEARTQLLNRTKILLNVSRHPGEFAGLRMILGMANGAMIVSEPLHRPEPYVAGTHYVESPLDQLASVIRHHLDHPEDRQRIANCGRQFVTEHLSIEQSVQRILDLADNAQGTGAAENLRATMTTTTASET